MEMTIAGKKEKTEKTKVI